MKSALKRIVDGCVLTRRSRAQVIASYGLGHINLMKLNNKVPSRSCHISYIWCC